MLVDGCFKKYLHCSPSFLHLIAGYDIDILGNKSKIFVQICQSWTFRSQLSDYVFGRF